MANTRQRSQADFIKNIKKEFEECYSADSSSPAKNTRSMSKLTLKQEEQVPRSSESTTSDRVTRFDPNISSSSKKRSYFRKKTNDCKESSSRPITRDSTRACTRASASEQRSRELVTQSTASKRTYKSRTREGAGFEDVEDAQYSLGKRTDSRSLSHGRREKKIGVPVILNGLIYEPPITRSQSSKILKEEKDVTSYGYNLRRYPWRVKRLDALAEAAKRRAGEPSTNIKKEISDLALPGPAHAPTKLKGRIKKEVDVDQENDERVIVPKDGKNSQYSKPCTKKIKEEDSADSNKLSKKERRVTFTETSRDSKRQERVSLPEYSGRLRSREKLKGKPEFNEEECYDKPPIPKPYNTRSTDMIPIKREVNKPEYHSTSSGYKKARVNKPKRDKTITLINPYFTRSSLRPTSGSNPGKSIAKLQQQDEEKKCVKSEELETPAVLLQIECIEKRTAKLSARKRAYLARPVRKYAESFSLSLGHFSQTVGGTFWQRDLSPPVLSIAPHPVDSMDVICSPMEEMEVSCEELYALNQEKMKLNENPSYAIGSHSIKMSSISTPKTEAAGKDDANDSFSRKIITTEDTSLPTHKTRKVFTDVERKYVSRRKQIKGNENVRNIGIASSMDAQRIQRKSCLRTKFAEWNLFECSATVRSHQAECECCDQPDGLDKSLLDELAERGRRRRGNGDGRSPLEVQLGVMDCSK